jgi:6-pyruvoyltetrahydropterin/6-carboxytetrahydropterin synthase
MHGHNYEIDITVNGPAGDDGFVIDFWDLDLIVHPVIEMIDHRTLNDIPGLENPTAENIALWFLKQVENAAAVRVYETKDCWADANRSDMRKGSKAVHRAEPMDD